MSTYVISIHAPAKGATDGEKSKSQEGQDFNPRTREGCDEIDPVELRESVNFNPRTREGCDISRKRIRFELGISIHAPAKGATWPPIVKVVLFFISIHAPAKGATAF